MECARDVGETQGQPTESTTCFLAIYGCVAKAFATSYATVGSTRCGAGDLNDSMSVLFQRLGLHLWILIKPMGNGEKATRPVTHMYK